MWQNFYQILRVGGISKLASLDTMIVTILFFTWFSSLLRVILGYFGNHFCVCFLFFENFLMKFCKDVFGITLTFTTLKIIFISCPPLLGAILAHFWVHYDVWSSISWQPFNVFSWNFSQISKNFMAPFYGLGSTVSRLQSHLEETVNLLPLSLQKVLFLSLL